MMESLLDSIKGPRRMSLDHWRFRMLHWCFGFKDAETAREKLPKCLYTHFCPLFHLTNLIVIAFPFILLGKVATGVFRVLVASVKLMIEKIEPLIRTPPTEEELQAVRRKKEIRQLFQLVDQHAPRPVEDFFFLIADETTITLSEAIELVAARERKRAQEREAADRRREIYRKQIVFWVKFSQAFVKAGLATCYLAAALLVGYLVWTFGATVAGAVVSLLVILWHSLFSVDAAVFAVTVCFCGLGGFGIFVGAVKFASALKEPVRNNLGPAIVPVVICRDAIADLWNWIGRAIWNSTQFVSLFYEENCPAIELVSGKPADDTAADDSAE